MLAALGTYLRRRRKKEEAAEILSRLQTAGSIAIYFALSAGRNIEVGMGENRQVCITSTSSIIERAAQTTFLDVDPELDSLRGEVQFRKIAGQIGSR